MTGATRNGNKNLTFNYLEYFVIRIIDLTNLTSCPLNISREVEKDRSLYKHIYI